MLEKSRQKLYVLYISSHGFISTICAVHFQIELMTTVRHAIFWKSYEPKTNTHQLFTKV